MLSRLSNGVQIAVMLAIFCSGVFVGLKLAPRQVLAASAPAGMPGCDMQGSGNSQCPSTSAGMPGSDAGTKTDGSSAMDMSQMDECPVTGATGHTDKPATLPSAPAKQPERSQTGTIYTCPMHPEVQSGKPGKCPKCGMTLVKKGS